MHAMIGALYEAAADREKWPNFLKLMADRYSAAVTQVVLGDPSDLTLRASWVHGADAATISKYVSYYYKLDPRKDKIVQLSGAVATYHDLVDDWDGFQRSEFFNDLLVPTDTQNGVQCPVGNRRSWFGTVAIMGPRVGTEAHLRELRELQPHMQRALQLVDQIATLRSRLAAAEDALDALSGAVIMTARDGRIVVANRAAQSLLRCGDALISVRGKLTAKRQTEAGQLQALITKSHDMATGKGFHSGGALQISRGDRRPLAVLVVPLRLGDARTGDGATVALFVRDPEVVPDQPEETLRALYGLTRSEASVALNLAAGLSINEIADSRDASVETARTQVKAILRKTDTGRQSELVKLLERQLGWLRAGP